jgi:hypothetical protein
MRLVTYAILLSSFLVSCSSTPVSTTRMLDARAEYELLMQNKDVDLMAAGQDSSETLSSLRTHSKVALVYIYPTRTSYDGIFWGGWVSIVAEPEEWSIKDNSLLFPQAISRIKDPPKQKLKKGTGGG